MRFLLLMKKYSKRSRQAFKNENLNMSSTPKNVFKINDFLVGILNYRQYAFRIQAKISQKTRNDNLNFLGTHSNFDIIKLYISDE